MSKPIAEVRGVAKNFGRTRALREAHLVLNPGEIHALMGENGAGKSTLVKILVGALQPDAGELRLDDGPLHLVGVAEAVAAGLVPIYQHRSSCRIYQSVKTSLPLTLQRVPVGA